MSPTSQFPKTCHKSVPNVFLVVSWSQRTASIGCFCSHEASLVVASTGHKQRINNHNLQMVKSILLDLTALMLHAPLRERCASTFTMCV